MVVYIGIKTKLGDRTETWYMGKELPLVDTSYETVTEIWAGGIEQAYIETCFSNIPMVSPAKQGVTWREPFAQFIFDNLE